MDGSEPVNKPGECKGTKATRKLINCLAPDRRVEVEVSATRIEELYFKIKENTVEIQEAYKHKMAAQLEEWNAQLNLLEAKVKNTSVDLEIKRARSLHELRAKHKAAMAKFHELEKSSGEAWNEVKITADVIWEDLKIGFAEAHSKFN